MLPRCLDDTPQKLFKTNFNLFTVPIIVKYYFINKDVLFLNYKPPNLSCVTRESRFMSKSFSILFWIDTQNTYLNILIPSGRARRHGSLFVLI